MPTTTRITSTTDWQQIAVGAAYCAVQMQSTGTVELFIGNTAPSEGDSGIILSDQDSQLPSHFSCGGLPVGSHLAVRAKENDVKLLVVYY